jgi:hypothetical protein
MKVHRLARLLTAFIAIFATQARAIPAEDVDFDDASTNLSASDVQEAIEAIDAAVMGEVASFRDLEFAEAALNAPAHGIEWPVSQPSVTEFFIGAMTTDEGGTLAQPDSVFCVAFNHDNCADARLNTAQHALQWKWEATRKEGPSDHEHVVNRVNFTASNGTSWSPWIFSIDVDDLTAGFEFNPAPGLRSFTLFESGEIRIGPEDPTPPTHTLEVNGTSKIRGDLEVEGDLSVSGAVSVGEPSNALLWGNAADPAFDTGAEICAASGLACTAANRPDGTALGCTTAAGAGIVYALCE